MTAVATSRPKRRLGRIAAPGRQRLKAASASPAVPVTHGGEKLCTAFDTVLDGTKERFWLAVPWAYTRDNHPWILDFINRVAAAKRRGIDVRIYLRPDPTNTYAVSVWRAAGIPVIQDTPRTRYLHTKLVVADHQALLTSTNLTDTDLFRNANEVTIIGDPAEVEEKAASILLLDEKLEPPAGDTQGAKSEAMLPPAIRRYLDVERLNPMQAGAIPRILHGTKNLVIAAPTGSGKTLVAEVALLAEPVLHKRLGIYMVPMRSIATEKRDDWARLEKRGLTVYKSTGEDDAFDPARALAADLLVTTPERLDAISRRTLPASLVAKIGTIVIDEVHLVDEPGRGSNLEALLGRLTLAFPRARLVAMSGTIPNAGAIAEWLQGELFESTWRPVTLVHAVIPYEESGSRQRDDEQRNSIAARIVRETLDEGAASLVFCGSRKGVESCAASLAAAVGSVPATPPAHTSHPVLTETLARGVGFHHAGLSPGDKRAVETAYRSGTIKVMVATSTVAAGVNLPARVVVVRDLNLGTTELSSATLLQMAGRAGRLGKETEGRCFVIAPRTKTTETESALRGRPVRSHLGEDLATYMNTEIALGIIRRREDIETWYRRTLHAYVSPGGAKMADALTVLLESGFVAEGEGGVLESTTLGKTTSESMIRVPTALALEGALAEWTQRPLARSYANVGELERDLLLVACERPIELGSASFYKTDEGILEEIAASDPRLKGWSLGRVRVLAVAASLLSGMPAAALPLDNAAGAAATAQGEVPRFLRFLARRSLERVPSLPEVMVAAGDLAGALDFGIPDRGAALLLDAIRRGYPPDHSRRRRVLAEYQDVRAKSVTTIDEALPVLQAASQTYLGQRPLGPLVLEVTGGVLIARTSGRGRTVDAHLLVQAGGREQHLKIAQADAGEMPLLRLETLGLRGNHIVGVECVLIASASRSLWGYYSAIIAADIPAPTVDYEAAEAALREDNGPYYERRDDARPGPWARKVAEIRALFGDGAPSAPAIKIGEPPVQVRRAAAIVARTVQGNPEKVEVVNALLSRRERVAGPSAPRPLSQCVRAATLSRADGALIAAALLQALGVEAAIVPAHIDGEGTLLCTWPEGAHRYGLPIWPAGRIETQGVWVEQWTGPSIPPAPIRPVKRWAYIAAYERLEARMLPYMFGMHAGPESEMPPSGPACPDCGGPMKQRDGPYSRFWGCAAYPTCKGMMPIAVDPLGVPNPRLAAHPPQSDAP